MTHGQGQEGETFGGAFGTAEGQRVLAALPRVVPFSQAEEATYYGAHYLVARALGISRPPRSRATWSHGWWDPKREVIDPNQLVSFGGPEDRHLVATQQLADTLARFGYHDVHAVGLPITYADVTGVERISGSLLVMPPHSLGHTQHRWPFERYAREIAAVRDRFSVVVLSLHPGCRDHGYWYREFERHGIPWVLGASGHDRNALVRMQTLLRTFEYVTTNAFGSHLAYAAYCGAKPSIYGTFAELEADDYKHDPYYSRFPRIKEAMVRAHRRDTVLARYPELFVDPDAAVERIAWGAETVGAPYRRKPRELATLLGWDVDGILSLPQLDWTELPGVVTLRSTPGEPQALRITGGRRDGRRLLLAVVLASSSPESEAAQRVFGRVWPLPDAETLELSLHLSAMDAVVEADGRGLAPSYAWNDRPVAWGHSYRLWVTLYHEGLEDAGLEQVLDVEPRTEPVEATARHAIKDVRYHATIAAEYDEVVVAPRAVTNDLVFDSFLPLVGNGRKMLDLGCGTGHMTLRFGHRFAEVEGVDHSPEMLARARIEAERAGLPHFVGVHRDVLRHVARLSTAELDLVCCTGFLHHLEPAAIEGLLGHVGRALRPGGILLVQEPIAVPPDSVPWPVRWWNTRSVAKRRAYSRPIPPDAEPDEAPLALDALVRAVQSAGLSVVKSRRHWELFPWTLPPRSRDRAGIALLTAAYGKGGNVLTLAARRPIGP